MLNEVTLLNEEQCYLRIKEDIRLGVLMPNQRLVEMDLAKSIGAGRAAIRTALARLEQEGLVEREHYRGARVRLITEKEAIEILEVRLALECMIVRLAAVKVTDEDVEVLKDLLKEMQHYHDSGQILKYSDINGKLHNLILKISGHSTAMKVLDTLHSQLVRFQFQSILMLRNADKSFEEHQAIVDAVARRDPDEAEQMMRLHLSRVLNALQEFS